MLSFRTMLPSAKVWKAPWHNIGPKTDESKTQQPVSNRKQLHRQRKWGGMGSAPGTKFTILWQQGWSEQKNALPRNYGSSQDLQSLIIVVSVYWLPSYYSSLVLLSTSKILMLVSVWSHPHCVCVHTENSFDEISRRNSWPTNTMTTVPKGMTQKMTIWNR